MATGNQQPQIDPHLTMYPVPFCQCQRLPYQQQGSARTKRDTTHCPRCCPAGHMHGHGSLLRPLNPLGVAKQRPSDPLSPPCTHGRAQVSYEVPQPTHSCAARSRLVASLNQSTVAFSCSRMTILDCRPRKLSLSCPRLPSPSMRHRIIVGYSPVVVMSPAGHAGIMGLPSVNGTCVFSHALPRNAVHASAKTTALPPRLASLPPGYAFPAQHPWYLRCKW